MKHSIRRTTLPVVAATALVATMSAPALATSTAYDKVEKRTTAQLKGNGLANRHLPTCADTDGTTAAGPMDALDYMAGDWLGYGWTMGEQGPASYVQTEHIRLVDGGETLSIDGTGLDPETAQVPVFTAHATASWDADSGTYVWEATSAGNTLTTELEVTEDGWAWEIPYGPGILMRYETTFGHNDRSWHETGEMTLDGGQTWMPVMDMTLVKTCDG